MKTERIFRRESGTGRRSAATGGFSHPSVVPSLIVRHSSRVNPTSFVCDRALLSLHLFDHFRCIRSVFVFSLINRIVVSVTTRTLREGWEGGFGLEGGRQADRGGRVMVDPPIGQRH